MKQSELYEFILKESYLENIIVDDNTRLTADLGINGDDGVELILKYSKQFNVDVSNFMAGKYFEGDGNQFISSILKIFSQQNSNKIKELTVGDLKKGIINGKLDEEVLKL